MWRDFSSTYLRHSSEHHHSLGHGWGDIGGRGGGTAEGRSHRAEVVVGGASGERLLGLQVRAAVAAECLFRARSPRPQQPRDNSERGARFARKRRALCAWPALAKVTWALLYLPRKCRSVYRTSPTRRHPPKRSCLAPTHGTAAACPRTLPPTFPFQAAREGAMPSS